MEPTLNLSQGIAKLLESGLEKSEGFETFCFFEGTSATGILAALADLASYIASEGPFQGVIGFSQGAALAATLMIQHGQNHLGSVDPLFRCAVFLCAGAPYDPAALERGKAVLLDDDGTGANCGGDVAAIHVPTAHVVGEKDDALGSSMALVRLCEPRTRRGCSRILVGMMCREKVWQEREWWPLWRMFCIWLLMLSK